MEIRMTPAEFEEVRRFLGATKNKKMIEEFNHLFDAKSTAPIRGMWTPVTKDMIIEISPENGKKLLQAVANNGEAFGDLIRKDLSVSSISKWVSFFKNLWGAIRKAIK